MVTRNGALTTRRPGDPAAEGCPRVGLGIAGPVRCRRDRGWQPLVNDPVALAMARERG